jgi:hypothetical protein
LIPETATLRCVCGALLLKILQARLHLADGLGRIDEKVASQLKSNPVFNELPAHDLLQQLANPSEDALRDELYGGLSSVKIQKVTLTHHFDFLTSANDVLFLAEGIRKVADSPAVSDIPSGELHRLKALCDLGYTLDKDVLLDFWFQRTSLPPECLRESNPDVIPDLDLPIFDPGSPPELPAADRQFLYPLIAYLQTIPPSTSDPSTLFQFLQHQLDRATAIGNLESQSRTSRIKAKLESSKKTETKIVQLVGEAIRVRVIRQTTTLATAFHVQRHLEDLRKCERDVSQLNRDLEPIIHLAIVRAFLATPEGMRHTAELKTGQFNFLGIGSSWQEEFQGDRKSTRLNSSHS